MIKEATLRAAINWYAKSPVTDLYSCFVDDRASYLIVTYLEAVASPHSSLESKARRTELDVYIATLRILRSINGISHLGMFPCQGSLLSP